MTRIRKPLIVVSALLVLVLSGCVRFQADLRLSPENTVDGSIVIAVIVGDHDDGRDAAAEAARDVETQLIGGLADADGVSREIYDQDGYLGSRLMFDATPLAAFTATDPEATLRIERVGDEFVFSGVLDPTPDDGHDAGDPDGDDSNVTVAITFPGAVTEHNGELSGTTVRWSTTVEGRVDMEARGSAIAPGPPVWVWILALAMAAVIAVAITLVVRRQRTARQ